jgi:tetratricopeptide (TPR) repeat protein
LAACLPEAVALNESGIAERERRPWGALLVLVAIGLVSYANTFSAPFIFDDIPALRQIGVAHDVGRPSDALAPPTLRGTGVAGRPVVALSLLLNRKISGAGVWSYHAFNVLNHVLAGLLLFGVVRRPQRLASLAARWSRDADIVALGIAAVWIAHPLQTESVTCIIQRTESLCGLFFFLTFYAFIRATTAPRNEAGSGRDRIGWMVLSLVSALVGVSTKEVMAVAPVLLVLYDRTFVSGSFKAAWAARGRWHLAFCGVWLVAAVSVWMSDVRGGTVGFGHGVTAWHYALTQCRAVIMYLKLAAWPHPLVLDYGTGVVRNAADVLVRGTALLLVLAGTIWLLCRRPKLGFLAAWTWVILAPSSSFVPLVTQTMAEHRMYLPLAGLIVLAFTVGRVAIGRRLGPIAAMLVPALMVTTLARNRDYRSVASIWQDNIAKWPTNPRAHYTLAQLADDNGNAAAAIAYGKAAVQLLPKDATARFNLAFSYAKAGQLEAAVTAYREAARLEPESIDAPINLGSVLSRLGRWDEAIAEFEKVVRLNPVAGEDQFNLAQAYAAAGRATDAIPHYEAALQRTPRSALAHYRLGMAWLKLRNYEKAIQRFRETIELDPTHFEAQVNLAGALMVVGRPAEAIPFYEAALRLQPGDPVATANLARARMAAPGVP